MRGRYPVEYVDEICRKRANAPRDRQAAAMSRARVINAGPAKAGTRSPQIMLKVIGWSKGAGAASRTAQYIGGKLDDELRQGLENQDGKQIDDVKALKAELKQWDILANDENRSAAWKKATEEERAEMSQNEALGYRQSMHMIVSLPPSLAGHKDDLHEAAREVLSETFGASGRKYLFALHGDGDKPHVHIVAQVRAPADDTGRRSQLRIGPEEIDVLRHKLATKLQERGIKIEASRRADRAELRAEIKAGKQPLKHQQEGWMDQTGGYNSLSQRQQNAAKRAFQEWAENNPGPAQKHGLYGYVSYVQEQAKARRQDRENTTEPKAGHPQEPSRSWLGRLAPKWYQAQGKEYEARRAGEAERPAEPAAQQGQKPNLFVRVLSRWKAPAPAPAATEQAAKRQPLTDPPAPGAGASRTDITAHRAQCRLNQICRDVYGDKAAAAAARFANLYQEKPRAAVWALANRPEAFGTPIGTTSGKFTGRGYQPKTTAATGTEVLPTRADREKADTAVSSRRKETSVEALNRTGQRTAAMLRRYGTWEREAQLAAATLEKEAGRAPQRQGRKAEKWEVKPAERSQEAQQRGREGWEVKPAADRQQSARPTQEVRQGQAAAQDQKQHQEKIHRRQQAKARERSR